MNDQQLARDYALQIAGEIAALQHVIAGDDYNCRVCGEEWSFCQGLYGPNGLYGPDSDCEDASLIHDFNPSESDAFEMLKDLAEYAGDFADTYAPNVADWLNCFCLEFRATGERHGVEWVVTGTKTLRTFGGPNCWIETNGGDWLNVSVHWGGDSHVFPVYAPDVVEALEILAVE